MVLEGPKMMRKDLFDTCRKVFFCHGTGGREKTQGVCGDDLTLGGKRDIGGGCTQKNQDFDSTR